MRYLFKHVLDFANTHDGHLGPRGYPDEWYFDAPTGRGRAYLVRIRAVL